MQRAADILSYSVITGLSPFNHGIGLLYVATCVSVYVVRLCVLITAAEHNNNNNDNTHNQL